MTNYGTELSIEDMEAPDFGINIQGVERQLRIPTIRRLLLSVERFGLSRAMSYLCKFLVC